MSLGRELHGLGSQHDRVLGDGERVQVDDAVGGVIAVEAPHPVDDRPQEVAEMDLAGGLDSREDACHGPAA